jgi:hypothetical protein
LVVKYKDKKLPAKAILRMAYCLANNIPSDTKLKFSSGEGCLSLFRSLGFHAGRLQTNDAVADEDAYFIARLVDAAPTIPRSDGPFKAARRYSVSVEQYWNLICNAEVVCPAPSIVD